MRRVDDYLANLHPTQIAVVAGLFDVIRQATPDASEAIKWALWK